MRIRTLVAAAVLFPYALSLAQPANPVEEELSALRARTDISFVMQAGWTIATSRDRLTTWSFTPSAHAAHPAFVKRRFYEKEGAVLVEMSAQCGAEKVACDALIADFRKLNQQLQESMRAPK